MLAPVTAITDPTPALTETVIETGETAMKTLGWSRLNTAVIVAMAIMLPGIAVQSTKIAKIEMSSVVGVNSGLAALNAVEASNSILLNSATSLRLSGVSLALR
jgi:hypothetical protein